MGERLTWEELVARYPHRWVVIKNAEKDGPNLINGVLVDVKTDDEIIPCKIANHVQNTGYDFYRTTEEPFSGIVSADFEITVD